MEVYDSRCAAAVIKSASPDTDVWLRLSPGREWDLVQYINYIQGLDHSLEVNQMSALLKQVQTCDTLTQALLSFWHLSVFFSRCQDEGLAIHEILRELESQCLSEISAMLNGEIPGDELGDLFFDCVDTEIKFYQWGGERLQELYLVLYRAWMCSCCKEKT